MKTQYILLAAAMVTLAVSIPFRDQIALVNSLEVGRNQDPMTWACEGCDDTNKPISSAIIEEPVEDVKAILSVYDEYTVLAFRYTATLKNIEQDILWAIQRQDEHAPQKCKVQKQMDNMWNSIRDYTLRGLKENAHTGRLIITGISLGGALSVLSWVDINHAEIFHHIQIVTFGAPRVGNKNWAAWFDTQTDSTRYFLKDDPIPILPRCLTLLCNYGQTGTRIRCIKKDQVCQYADSDDENFTLMSPGEYISALSTAIDEHSKQAEHQNEGYGIGILDHIYEYKHIKVYTLKDKE